MKHKVEFYFLGRLVRIYNPSIINDRSVGIFGQVEYEDGEVLEGPDLPWEQIEDDADIGAVYQREKKLECDGTPYGRLRRVRRSLFLAFNDAVRNAVYERPELYSSSWWDRNDPDLPEEYRTIIHRSELVREEV